MSVRIIIDSSSDFEDELARDRGLIVIPMKCTFGTREYAEGVDITREEFYTLLQESEDFPHTSQITPFEFAQALDEIGTLSRIEDKIVFRHFGYHDIDPSAACC